MITSTSNHQIKQVIQLQKKSKLREKEQVFIVEGRKMFEEAKDFIRTVYVTESFYEAHKNEYNYFASINYEIVTEQVMKSMSDTITPQGVLAIVNMPKYHLEDMVTEEQINLLLLEDIRDPGNLGTIIRTAEGAGITGVILSKHTVDLFNPKVIRSTMGSIYRVPYIYVEDIRETITYLKKHNIIIYASHLDGESVYDKEHYKNKTGIIIGNEANGITEEIAKLADVLVKIPMEGSVESLNAAVAASILMYEIYRQKREN